MMETNELINLATNIGAFGAIAFLLWRRLVFITDTYLTKLETLEERHRQEISAQQQTFNTKCYTCQQRMETLMEKSIESMLKTESSNNELVRMIHDMLNTVKRSNSELIEMLHEVFTKS